MIPLIIYIVTKINSTVVKEDKPMNNKNAIDVLNVSLNVINNLSGNIAGGALLTNVLYDKFRFVGMKRWKEHGLLYQKSCFFKKDLV